MGGGLAKNVSDTLQGASDKDLVDALASLSKDDRERLAKAIASGSAAAGPPFSQEFIDKMKACNDPKLPDAFIKGWIGLYESFCGGETGMMSEATIDPVGDDEVKSLESLEEGDVKLLGETVLLKLNGGLGTGMGLAKAKSLLELKDGNTFLDLIAQQVLQIREKYPVKFMLMNSFSTEKDTKEFFKKYKTISEEWDSVAFMQNMSPKVLADTKKPGVWPAKPDAEWCPPGHGDIYAAFIGSGKLQELLKAGYKYAFVSNSDNLGATMNTKILGYLASSGAPMIMEVCVRGEDDKKGGHLAKNKASGDLVLRESAQCPEADEPAFQDITKHKFFNTNNLWLNLEKLQKAVDDNGGSMPLPIIVNEKKMDPSSKDDQGPTVYQLETAMGAAIANMPGSKAVVVPFERFSPVKTCNQLLGLKSDAYVISDDCRPVLAEGANKVIVSLDKNYKMVPDLQVAIQDGKAIPSLKDCQKLTIKGKVMFEEGVICKGKVTFANSKDERATIKAGTYEGDVNL